MTTNAVKNSLRSISMTSQNHAPAPYDSYKKPQDTRVRSDFAPYSFVRRCHRMRNTPTGKPTVYRASITPAYAAKPAHCAVYHCCRRSADRHCTPSTAWHLNTRSSFSVMPGWQKNKYMNDSLNTLDQSRSASVCRILFTATDCSGQPRLRAFTDFTDLRRACKRIALAHDSRRAQHADIRLQMRLCQQRAVI
jgi:hypothetical protein